MNQNKIMSRREIKNEIINTYKDHKDLETLLNGLKYYEQENLGKLLCSKKYNKNKSLANEWIKILLKEKSYKAAARIIGSKWGLNDKVWAREILELYALKSDNYGFYICDDIYNILNDQVWISKIFEEVQNRPDILDSPFKYGYLIGRMGYTHQDKNLIQKTLNNYLIHCKTFDDYLEMARGIWLPYDRDEGNNVNKEIFIKVLQEAEKKAQTFADVEEVLETVPSMNTRKCMFTSRPYMTDYDCELRQGLYKLYIKKAKTFDNYITTVVRIECFIEKEHAKEFVVDALKLAFDKAMQFKKPFNTYKALGDIDFYSRIWHLTEDDVAWAKKLSNQVNLKEIMGKDRYEKAILTQY